jgi:hypothetical protein
MLTHGDPVDDTVSAKSACHVSLSHQDKIAAIPVDLSSRAHGFGVMCSAKWARSSVG